MNERIRARRWNKWTCLAATVALALVGVGIVAAAPIQKKSATGASQPAKAPAGKSSSTESAVKSNVDSSTVQPSSANLGAVAAVVNGEEITYKALAEEVIARKGTEVLETMISRKLVEQACRERGIKITAQEIDEEIRRTADRLGMSPEQYLKLLKEKRNMTYQQYERDIVWPGLALKKMAKPSIKVTEQDIERGFEAYYGEKVKCRWIMFENLQTAMKVWNELKESDKDGDGKIKVEEFESQVTRWSIDPGSRALGGQLQPIAHHTSPAFKAIEDAAFALKEDGEISKVVQFGDSWVIMYREARLTPQNVKLEDVRDRIEGEIYEAKMRDQIEQIFERLQKNATIQNLLTGEVLSPDKKTVPAEHVEKAKQEPGKASGKQEPPKKGATAPKK